MEFYMRRYREMRVSFIMCNNDEAQSKFVRERERKTATSNRRCDGNCSIFVSVSRQKHACCSILARILAIAHSQSLLIIIISVVVVIIGLYRHMNYRTPQKNKKKNAKEQNKRFNAQPKPKLQSFT